MHIAEWVVLLARDKDVLPAWVRLNPDACNLFSIFLSILRSIVIRFIPFKTIFVYFGSGNRSVGLNMLYIMFLIPKMQK